MNLVQVKIRGTVITARYGTLVSGDVLRTDAEYARHLVEDCSAGEYIGAQAAPALEAAAAPASKPRKAKG